MIALEVIEKLIRYYKSPGTKLKSIISKGFSFASHEIVSQLVQIDPLIKTIIDVGANKGQFTVAASNFYPEAMIYSFEPLKSVYEILKKNVAGRNCKCFNFAVGDSSGEIEFYENQYSLASSVKKITKKQNELFPETNKTEKIIVPLNTLNEIIPSLHLVNKILLKLDVQGYEKEVINGALHCLDRISYLLIEMSFVRMYEEELLFEEMHSFLSDLGFNILSPLGVLYSNKNQILQIDMLYKNIKQNK